MLTRKQYELLMYIEASLRDGGVSPSFDEMKEALGLKSKSGIHRLITGLEERGFIRRLPHRARALEVLKLPENAQPLQNAQKTASISEKSFTPSVIEGQFGISGANVDAEASDAVQFRCMDGLLLAPRLRHCAILAALLTSLPP